MVFVVVNAPRLSKELGKIIVSTSTMIYNSWCCLCIMKINIRKPKQLMVSFFFFFAVDAYRWLGRQSKCPDFNDQWCLWITLLGEGCSCRVSACLLKSFLALPRQSPKGGHTWIGWWWRWQSQGRYWIILYSCLPSARWRSVEGSREGMSARDQYKLIAIQFLQGNPCQQSLGWGVWPRYLEGMGREKGVSIVLHAPFSHPPLNLYRLADLQYHVPQLLWQDPRFWLWEGDLVEHQWSISFW